MAINEEDIIYVLTKTDVEDIAKDIGITKLTELHYQKVQQFFDSYVDGPYNWTDAVSDGLRDAEEELRGGYNHVSENKDEISRRIVEPRASPLLNSSGRVLVSPPIRLKLSARNKHPLAPFLNIPDRHAR